MSRILEFQPTDEQTIVARVLVELHQAIDVSFPDAKPSARQFSRTVLTNQGESTRVDNAPPPPDDAAPDQDLDAAENSPSPNSQVSMTPKTGVNARGFDAPLPTGHLQKLIVESRGSFLLRRLLVVLLCIGVIAFIWLNFLSLESSGNLNH
jgi:hypothetical protein